MRPANRRRRALHPFVRSLLGTRHCTGVVTPREGVFQTAGDPLCECRNDVAAEQPDRVRGVFETHATEHHLAQNSVHAGV